ncbi:MAG: Na(+)-translocating NADH-quinone reductase subunit C [Deltaproteobacteria bacterium]|nr:Na(+)-translocating NADH-quinone reductase subunit C [Deltaproteobacteria bacterium]MBW2383398.1 Na(+)-translocating NADH-quinone reductase subunit C [Deltaproteobacteria bacterium]
MQQHSTGYIIGFSAAICVVCALFVAGSAVSLKERQERNALIDKQTNVLAVAGLIADGQKLSSEEVEQIFSESIQARVIDMATGDENASIASDSFDQRRAAKDPAMSTPAPSNRSKVLRIPNQGLIYEVRKDGRLDAVIIPIEGMGLWSILYGYIALAPDATTIRGITYYEQKETAGLGGEVENPSWKAKWVGRRAFDERGNVKIEVKKGIAGPPDLDPYRVDGLAGATLTSRGVTNMLRFWLGDDGFGPYLAKLRDSQAAQGG